MKTAQLKGSGLPGVGYLFSLFSLKSAFRMRILTTALLIIGTTANAQTQLSLKDAIKIALDNYGTIKAKQAYVKASTAAVVEAKLDYLPNFNLAAQTDYGTANGQN